MENERLHKLYRHFIFCNLYYYSVGLHCGSTLSLYFFTLVLDVLIAPIQGPMFQCMFFVDEIVLAEDSREEIHENLKLRRQVLEAHGFH